VSSIELLERGARLNPDGDFLVAEGLSIGYAEALSWCRRLARALRANGFSPGEHAAILSGNDPTPTSPTSRSRSGPALYPHSSDDSPADAVRVLKKLDCDLLFYQQAAEPLVATLREQLPRIRKYVALDVTDSTDRPSRPSSVMPTTVRCPIGRPSTPSPSSRPPGAPRASRRA